MMGDEATAVNDLSGRAEEVDVVKRLSGVSDEDRIAISETGWTSRVYIVDGGKTVFKFPRNEEYRIECRKEADILELLGRHRFDIGIPVLNWAAPDHSYFGYHGIQGAPLKDVIDALGDAEKEDIGRQLGGFLKQLHSIPGGGGLGSQTLEEQVVEYTKMYLEDRSLLGVYFDEQEMECIDGFFTHDVKECMKGSGELVLCHGDLDCNNTLVGAGNRVGVIDFGDAGLYDRSQDFRGIEDRVILTAMMDAYGEGEVLSLEAAEATAKMICILNLPYIIRHRDAAERDECIARIRRRFSMRPSVEAPAR